MAYLVANAATLTSSSSSSSSYTMTNEIESDKDMKEKRSGEMKALIEDNDEMMTWRCNRCTFLNESFHKRCAICNMSRRRDFEEEDDGNEIVTNWICGVCRFQNSAAASRRCVFCNASRKCYHEDITTTTTTTTVTMDEEKVDDVMIEDEDDDETKEDANKKKGMLTLRCPEVVSTLSMCCDKVECLERRMISCPRRLDCGHLCGGIRGEFAPSNSKSRVLGDVVDAGFDMNLSSGNLEISNKGLHVSASPGNGSKLAVLNRSFDWGIVIWKMTLAPSRRETQMLLGCVSMLGPEDKAVVPFYSYDAYRINAAKSDAFFYSPTTGALFERGVELPTRIECCGPGSEILFELDLRSRTMSISINSRIQSVTFNDVPTGVRSVSQHYFLTN